MTTYLALAGAAAARKSFFLSLPLGRPCRRLRLLLLEEGKKEKQQRKVKAVKATSLSVSKRCHFVLLLLRLPP
jgi:hypothetical protein